MAEETAEAKLAEAEAKLTEQALKVTELEEKLAKIPNNPEHFDKVKKERDEAKRKLKEIEDAQAEAKGEFEKLANERLTELEIERAEKEKLKLIAEQWTTYEKSKRESLLAKLTDAKVKKLAEQMTTLEALEEFVEMHIEGKFNPASGNHKGNPPPPKDNKPKYVVSYKENN
jgi:alanyl-tRNA synthetase